MKIAVIGLGLIGTSIIKSLKNKGYYTIAVSQTEESIKKALSSKLADKAGKDIKLAKEADVVFVCTPINATVKTLQELNSIFENSNTKPIVADVASIKADIISFAEENLSNVKFIGTHPMAGTEHKGFDAGDENLFQEAKWVICPSDKTSSESLEILSNIIKDMGAHVVYANAKEHDTAVAQISHMPLVISQALFMSTGTDLAKKLASSGFRDTTRLAATNTEIAKDMVLTNKKNVKKALENFRKALDELEKSIDDETYEEKIETIAKQRKEMYSENGKNNL